VSSNSILERGKGGRGSRRADYADVFSTRGSAGASPSHIEDSHSVEASARRGIHHAGHEAAATNHRGNPSTRSNEIFRDFFSLVICRSKVFGLAAVDASPRLSGRTGRWRVPADFADPNLRCDYAQATIRVGEPRKIGVRLYGLAIFFIAGYAWHGLTGTANFNGDGVL